MVSIGTPTVYHFHTSVKIPENPNNKLLSEKKRSLVKWANVVGVSSANLNYLWDHIIGDIVETNETSNSAIMTEIKDLRITVESLKATIDELVASNKYITMKLMEQEKNYLAVVNKNMPDVKNNTENDNNTTYDNDYAPPQKVFKKSKNTTTRPSLDKNLRGDVNELEKEIADTTKILNQLKDCSNVPDVILPLATVNKLRRTMDNFKTKPGILKSFLGQTKYETIFEVIRYFPVETYQDLYDLEVLTVQDNEFAEKLGKFLKVIKPTSTEEIPTQFRLIMNDDVASSYSYLGHPHKAPFKQHWLCDRVFEIWKESFSSEEYQQGLNQFFYRASERVRRVTLYHKKKKQAADKLKQKTSKK